MDTGLIVGLSLGGVALLIIIALLVFVLWRRRSRSKELQETFGPEYERTMTTEDGRSNGQRELEERVERVEGYALRDLSSERRDEYVERWRRVQAIFVDRPSEAVADADVLVVEVMRRRGYRNVDDPEMRVDDLSVGHGDEAVAYREACELAERNRRGDATTEDLRQAMTRYRRVFDALLAREPARQV